MARDTRAGSSHLHFVLYENLRGGVCYNAFLSGFLAAEIKMGIAEIIFVRVPLENLDVKKISPLPSHISFPSTYFRISGAHTRISITTRERRTYFLHLPMDKTKGRSVPASLLDIGTIGGHVLMSYWSVHWTNIRIWTSACTCEE